MPPRRFPAPWSVEGLDARYVVKDSAGQGHPKGVSQGYRPKGMQPAVFGNGRPSQHSFAVLQPPCGMLTGRACGRRAHQVESAKG
jgi:hypothetical protein